MQIKLLLLLISIFSSYTNAAQYCLGNYKKKLLPSAAFSSKTIVIPFQNHFCKAPLGGNHDIVFLICSHYDNIEDAAKTVNILAQTNKFLNTLIDDNKLTLKLIKSLSMQFNCSNSDVSKRLCTRAANNQYLLQELLISDWINGNTVKNLPKLKSMGVDLNFTYGNNSYPALLRNVVWEGYGYAEVGKWLIKNGADINVVDHNGRSAFMYALNEYNKTMIPLFLKHDLLKVHHQDNDDNTLLHYCIGELEYGSVLSLTRCEYMLGVIEKLLQKGADPTVKNKNDKTPLDFARAIECQPMIDLLEKAIANFY